MKIPKFLAILMALLVMISVPREIEGAKKISLEETLMTIGSFKYSDQNTLKTIQMIITREQLMQGNAKWNPNISLLDNIQNFCIAVLNFLIAITNNTIDVIWAILWDTATTFSMLYKIIMQLMGYI